jgi:hypothetical protein
VKKRIKELRAYLDPKDSRYQRSEQHRNIKAAIKLYQAGKIDGLQKVCIMDGEIVVEKEMFEGSSWAWVEVSSTSSKST